MARSVWNICVVICLLHSLLYSAVVGEAGRYGCPVDWTIVGEAETDRLQALCVKLFKTPVTWEEARNNCHSNYAHLATMDENFFRERNYQDIAGVAKAFATLLRETGVDSGWMGVRKQSTGKLWWSSDIPRPVNIIDLQNQVLRWAVPSQPDDRAGGCGRFWGVADSQSRARDGVEIIECGLDSCERALPYMCMRGAQLKPVIRERCPEGWEHDAFSHRCFYVSTQLQLTYESAQKSCRSMQAQLVSPASPHLHNVTEALMRKHQVRQAWLGLYRNPQGRFRWASGAPWDRDVSRLHRDDITVGRCFLMDLQRDGAEEREEGEEGKEWKAVSCDVTRRFLCEMPATAVDVGEEGSEGKDDPGESQIVSHPRDLRLSSDDLPDVSGDDEGSFDWTKFPVVGGEERKIHNFSCNVTSWFSGSHVIWEKDGVYVDNGPAPQGLTLLLDGALVGKLRAVTGGPVALDGRYRCMVWADNPYRPLLSRRATLTVTDQVVLRLSAPLLPGTVAASEGRLQGSLRHSRLLYGNGGVLASILNTLAQSVFQLDIAGKDFPATLYIDRIRPDDVTADVSVRYALPTLRRDGLSALVTAVYDVPPPGSVRHVLANAFYTTLSQRLTEEWPTAWMEFMNMSRNDIHLRTIGFCPYEKQMRGAETLFWPLSVLEGDWEDGEEVTSNTIQTCFADGVPLGSARCVGNFSHGAERVDVQYHGQCPEPPKSNVTDALKQLAETFPKEDADIASLGRDVVTLTSNPKVMVFTDVAYSAVVIENLAASVPRMLGPGGGADGVGEVGESLMTSADNLLRTEGEQIRQADRANGAASRILRAIDRFANHAALDPSLGSLRFVRSKIALEIRDITDGDAVIPSGFGARSGFHETLAVDAGTQLEDVVSAITLPEEVYHVAQHTYETLQHKADPDIDLDLDFDLDLYPQSKRVTFSVFTTDQFFVTDADDYSEETKLAGTTYTPAGDNKEANSMIVAATINGIRIENLTQPVETVFLPKQDARNFQCVFWDFGSPATGHAARWSSDGCWFAGRRGELVVCHCDHLTNFAILTDPTRTEIPEEHHLALTMITYVGLALSILGLSLTILSFLLFRKLRKGRGQKVLFNLALALLLVDVIFAAGILQTEHVIACTIVSAMLQYFLLVAFAWMLVEGVLQYLRFVKVLDTYVENFMWKAAIPAWVLPAVPGIIIAAYDWTLFRGPAEYCWLSLPAFYYGFLIPVAVIIVINTVLFVLVIKGLTCDRPKGLQTTQTQQELAWLQLRAGICCFIVLGLTWIFGFLAVADARLVFQYLFCLFNAFQGFLIFLFHNLRERAVRDAWSRCCCCCSRPDTNASSIGLSSSGSAQKYVTSNTESSDMNRSIKNNKV